jgi:chorismate dehydratase
VNLFHRGPLDSVQRVALDTSSRTGVALVKVLLHERLGRDPEYLPLPPSVPEMLAAADAALVIGDPALDFEGDAERLDLGEEWRARTGLPFVFAFWAGPPGVVAPADVARLQRALEDGRRNIAAIAARYNAGAAAHRNESYLRTNVVFSLGEEEQAGLREFYRRAHALRLIPRVPELRFHGQA